MQSASLSGRSILIVEDEPLILLDISTAFEKAGAVVVAARSIAEAARHIEQDGFSAAVVDFGLADGDADAMCERLEARDISYVLHSGYSHIAHKACRRGVVIPKPAKPETLLDAIVQLLKRHNDENPPALHQGDDVRA